MSINAAGGSKVFIAPVTVTADTLTEYEGLTWTEIGETESIGEFGDQSNPITFTSLSDSRVRNLKGPRDAGDIAIVVGADPADVGQLALVAAEATKFNYPFKVVENDAITPSGDGTVSYFQAQVMSKRKNIGDATNVVRRNFSAHINTEILEVAAS